MMMAVVEQLVLAAFVGLTVWAMISDARTLTIPNRICVAVAALWPAWLATQWGSFDLIDPFAALGVAGLALVFGFAIFAAGWAGGGDVKLLAALALWAGPPAIVSLLVVTAMAGGAVALGTLGARLLSRRWAEIRGDAVALSDPAAPLARVPLPYGVAIGIGGIYVATVLSGFLV